MRAPEHGGLRIDILGDSGPFSRFGRSIGYRIRGRVGGYLIDCGAPLFDSLREPDIAALRGVIGTHSHDDHRRWFTDLALYKRYIAPVRERLRLYATEAVHEEFMKNSRGALERTLSADSRRVVEAPYEDFVDARIIGPRPRFRIRQVPQAGDSVAWRVVDADGEVVDPALAKVVIHDRVRANRPRLLFKDAATGEWVEPESFYALADRAFYEEAQNPILDEEAGLEIRPFKEPVWHGPPTIGVEIRTPGERVIFSSDTVYNPDLWRQLADEYRPQRLDRGREAFEKAYLVYGDINHLIERTWSRARLEAALKAYEGALVVHDVSDRGSVVHTEYDQIARHKPRFHLLTHSPDNFVSELPLATTGKTYRFLGSSAYEERNGELLDLNADLYVRQYPDTAVGFLNPAGKYRVVDDGGFLRIRRRTEPSQHPTRFCVDLYRDIGGGYYEEPGVGEELVARADGKVERLRRSGKGSRGVVDKDLRADLARRKALRVESAGASGSGGNGVAAAAAPRVAGPVKRAPARVAKPTAKNGRRGAVRSTRAVAPAPRAARPKAGGSRVVPSRRAQGGRRARRG